MLWVDRHAIKTIQRETQRRRILETGGGIFGYESDDQTVVAIASLPGARAKHRRASFTPDRTSMEQVFRAVHELSEGRYRYLGSWHSHPLGRGTPSRTDAQTAFHMASEPDVRLLRPLLLVQATRLTRRGSRLGDLKGYRWSRLRERLENVEFSIVELEDRVFDEETLRRRLESL
jgi:integrative and conjugative element protein (TIGR02256 family)